MVFWRGSKAQVAARPERALPEGERVYAIGDVHGCDRQLAAMLSLIAADNAHLPPARVSLVMLGDYIDRGPASAAVLQRLGQPLSWCHQTVLLKGNHEEMLETFLADPAYGAQWRHFGGLETVASFGIDVAEMRRGRGLEAAREALATAMAGCGEMWGRLVLHHAIGDYFFCHAGVRPGVALDQQSEKDLLWIRGEFLSADHDFGKIIVHGHTPVEKPEIARHRINVDTGAYATGLLSCVVLDGTSARFLSVDATGTLVS